MCCVHMSGRKGPHLEPSKMKVSGQLHKRWNLERPRAINDRSRRRLRAKLQRRATSLHAAKALQQSCRTRFHIIRAPRRTWAHA